MAIGQKMGSLKNLKQAMAKGSAGGAWIKYIPKNGNMNVRFIQEPEEWVNYVEHYDQLLRKSYPCNGESNCPGCAGNERKSSRYLANVVDRDDKDRVIPLQMPKDLANRLVVRYERNGTLTDRDFELSRSGEGLDTTYDLDAQAVDRAKIDKFAPLDLLQVLEDAYQNVFGQASNTVEEKEEITPPTSVRGRKKSASAGVAHEVEADVEEDTDDDENEQHLIAEGKATNAELSATTAAAIENPPVDGHVGTDAPEPEFVADDEDAVDDAADEPDTDDEGDGDTYTEEELRALPFGALRSVARDFGVDTKGKSADAIIGEIMSGGEPVDEPGF